MAKAALIQNGFTALSWCFNSIHAVSKKTLCLFISLFIECLKEKVISCGHSCILGKWRPFSLGLCLCEECCCCICVFHITDLGTPGILKASRYGAATLEANHLMVLTILLYLNYRHKFLFCHLFCSVI